VSTYDEGREAGMVDEIAPNLWDYDELTLLLPVDEMWLLGPSLVAIEAPDA